MKSPEYQDSYIYAFTLGILDGKTAADFISQGKPVNHGDLLSATDPYAVGYRHGLKGGS